MPKESDVTEIQKVADYTERYWAAYKKKQDERSLLDEHLPPWHVSRSTEPSIYSVPVTAADERPVEWPVELLEHWADRADRGCLYSARRLVLAMKQFLDYPGVGLPKVLNRYFSRAFEHILAGTDSNEALGLKIGGKSKGANHDRDLWIWETMNHLTSFGEGKKAGGMSKTEAALEIQGILGQYPNYTRELSAVSIQGIWGKFEKELSERSIK